MYKVSNNAISAKCELVLRTDFPSPPNVNLGRRTWSRVQYGGAMDARLNIHPEVPELKLARDDTAYLTQGVLLSALAAVLLLGNYRRIRRLLNALLRGSAMGNNRARNRSRVSYHGEEASNTIAISQMSTGSERPPAETLHRRGLKKHSNYANICYHLEAGAEINARNPSYGTPLSTAARHGRNDVVNLLSGRSADVQSRTDIFAEAALHAAAEGGYEAIVATLLDNGADVDAKFGGISPIYAAASRRHRPVVQFLLQGGANTGILMDFLPETLQMFSMSLRYNWGWKKSYFPYPWPVLLLQDSTEIIDEAVRRVCPNAAWIILRNLSSQSIMVIGVESDEFSIESFYRKLLTISKLQKTSQPSIIFWLKEP